MKILFSILCLFCLFGLADGQTAMLVGTGAPAGACISGQITYRDIASGNFYDCVASVWHLTTFSWGNVQNVDTTNAANVASGTLPAGRMPALTGDVTTSAGGVATTIGATKVTNAMLAGSIDLTSKVTGVLPWANGGNAGSAATSATTGTMTVSMTTSVVTITPSGACTFNATGGLAGQQTTFVVTTSGSSSFVLTWGTNYKTVGTLATGVTTAKTFAVTFVNTNGTTWVEVARTTAM